MVFNNDYNNYWSTFCILLCLGIGHRKKTNGSKAETLSVIIWPVLSPKLTCHYEVAVTNNDSYCDNMVSQFGYMRKVWVYIIS